MKRSALVALLALPWACGGGHDTDPRFVWSTPTATVSAAGITQVTLSVVPGTIPMPRAHVTFCVFETGGAPSGAPPPGHCSLTSPLPPGCVIPPSASPFCVDSGECRWGCDFTFSFMGANAGGGTGALPGTWTWEARGPSPLPPSDPIAVTQTVP
jgi:hypothetical protein